MLRACLSKAVQSLSNLYNSPSIQTQSLIYGSLASPCLALVRNCNTMSTLYSRIADPAAVAACSFAHQSSSTLAFSPVSDLASLRCKGSNPFSTNKLVLLSASGLQLTDLTAICGYLDSSLSIEARQWLEWVETCLQPAAYLGGKALENAIKHLEAALDESPFLGGSQPSYSDVAVYSVLLPLQQQSASALSAPVSGLLSKVAAVPAVQKGLEQVLAGQPLSSVLNVFQQDAAAYVSSKPKLPIPGQRNILITSALPYVNNVPHLGNIIGCVLSADCYARFCRARGHNCIYVCGTDEYGTATETKALEEGLTCQQICDKYNAIHSDIYRWFDIAFDRFGRTPTRWQTEIAQSIFHSVQNSGNLVEQEMQQLYSEALGKFLADRFVSGKCPKCGYEDARGDQCDGCGSLLNPTELINPKCKITGTTPVIRSTKHIFLDLPKLSPQLQEYIDKTSQLGGWSSNCVQITQSWMRDGLKYRCITRDLKWGTPVPAEGYEEKVFYVWFDAPIGYISITANYTPEWERWWKNPEDVELVQFMGKDNVPFHTVIFPATLLGTGEKWTMMRNISVTEYLNYEGGKFSKSRGTGVFGNDAKDTGIPVEVWRYYLLSNRPEQSDTDFKWSDLAAKNNSELLANLGNFVNRALMFVSKFFEGRVPAATDKGADAVAEFGKSVGSKVEEYVAALEKIKIKEGIRLAMAVSADGNKFLQDTQPWVLVKQDKEHCATIVAAGVGLVRVLAALVQPYMPSLTAKILAQLDLPASAADLTDELLQGAYNPASLVPAGHELNSPQPLISAISDEKIEELRCRYGGSQAERTATASISTTAPAAKAGKPAPAVKEDGKAASKGADKGDKAKGEKPAKKMEESGPPDVSKLDIRVGFIKKAWRHPDADSLYVEEIDVGEEQPRQVVSGLVKYVPEAEMQQRRCVVICNMKPANMRGIQSQAMVLCANNADGTVVELLEPPEGAQVGERISVQGYLGEPEEQLNPKKKIFEQVQPDLLTNSDKLACYKGVPLMTSAGPLTVRTVVGGSIK